MKIKFLGAVKDAGEVTGSRTLLTLPDGMNILVDFGIIQSNLGNIAETMAWNGRDFEFDVDDIDVVILTHAHADHTSLIPLLIKRGYEGKIISTAPTADFCAISFPDSAKIMESDCIFANKRRPKNQITPLYSIGEGQEAARRIRCYDYNRDIRLSDNTSVELLSAGHMLGACMPKITYRNGNDEQIIVFTGDTSAKSSVHPFLREADDIGKTDYIVTESTYGDRTHDKYDHLAILGEAVKETCLENRKTLVIPVFSMQRSSEIIWFLREAYMANPNLFEIPIYLDTPMGILAQGVIDSNREYWGEEWIKRDGQLTNIFDWDGLTYIESFQSSRGLANPNPKVILSASGMATGGRILDHLRSFLPVRGCKILFCGYQAEHSLGRKLIDRKQKSVAIQKHQIQIRADVDSFSLSSHADKNQLVEFLKTSDRRRLKKILTNHGDEGAVNAFHDELDLHFKSVNIIKPKYDREIQL